MRLSLLQGVPGALAGFGAGACASAMLALVVISALFLAGLDLPDDEAREVVAGAGLLGAIIGAMVACRSCDGRPTWTHWSDEKD